MATKMDYAKEIADVLDAKVYEKRDNGTVKIGIVPQTEDGAIAPVVYIDDMYDNGVDVDTAIERVKRIIESVSDDMESTRNALPDFFNFEKIKSRLTGKLVGADKANDYDVYMSAERYGFEDIIIVPYIILKEDEEGRESVKVHPNMLDSWNVSLEKVVEIAINNSDAKIQTLFGALVEMNSELVEETGIKEDDLEVPLLVVTNKTNVMGAFAILNAKKYFDKTYRDGYVVLPSSIHEVLVLPYDGRSKEELVEMVTEINATQVKPNEVLTNNAYFFNVA